MITPPTLQFLRDLKENNNREWFGAHKKEYEAARRNTDALVLDLTGRLARIDPSIGMPELKECTFRIYRDVRFSPDKSPYKTHFGIYVAKGGRKSILPGYYLHIEPGASMMAGGVYMPEPGILKSIRNEIYFNSAEFRGIIGDPGFVRIFGQIDPFDKLKKAPKDFPADYPDIELLKYKSYTVFHYVTDEQLLASSFTGYAESVYKTMVPFQDFLRRAIEQR
jgi:uncharacterized protein (TIGR02453 family)